MAGRQPILIFSSNTQRESGRKVQLANVAAAKAVADIVRTSLGPNSMLKMLLSPTGGITVTNDGNAILREVDVSHPSAKSMIELSRSQDEEVGDGTTSVIILAGELLSLAAPWIEKNLHPSVIIHAYQAALEDALVHLNRIALPLDLSNREQLLAVVTSVVGTKFSREQFLCNFALDAVATCLVESGDGRKDIDLKRYCRVEKIPGGELEDSQLVKGVVLNKDITHSNMRRRIENPRVIILDCALEYQKLETKTNLIVEKNEDLQKLIKLEEEFVINMCNQICKFKPDLVITEKGLSDLAQHIFLKHNITALRRTKKTDNNRIARTTGATIVNDPNDLLESDVGTATLFEIRKIGDEYFTFIINEKVAKTCTIILRGGSKDVLSEMDRTLQDALQVARNVYLEPKLLHGGGAAEMSLAAHLSEKAKQVEGVQQWPYRSAAIAFEVIPRTLALNCGANIVKLLTELRAKHASSLLENSCWGVDGRKGTIIDMKTIPVFDSYAVKVQTIKTAFEAATLLLRVDDIFSGLKKKEKMGAMPQDNPGME